MARDRGGPEPAQFVHHPEQAVGQQLVVEQEPDPGQSGPVDGPVVALGQHAVRVREPVELDVVVGVRVAANDSRVSSSGPGRSAARSRNAGTQLSVTSVSTPSAPRPDPRGREDVRMVLGVAAQHLPSAGDECQPSTWLARPPSRGAGAVRAGGQRTGDGLPVDVAEILHRQAERGQCSVELGDRGSGADRHHGAGALADRARAVEGPTGRTSVIPVSRSSRSWTPSVRAIGGERVPGADRLHAEPALRRGGHHGRELVDDSPGDSTLDGSAVLVPGPVAPGGAPSSEVHPLTAVGRHGLGPTRRRPPGAASSKRSHSSPALACRNQTRSPTRRFRAPGPRSGVCTSPAPSLSSSLSPARPDRGRQPRPARRAGRDIAAGIGDRVPGAGSAGHRGDEVRRGPGPEGAVAVEQGGAVQPGAGRQLRQRRIAAGDVQTAGAAAVDQGQRTDRRDGLDHGGPSSGSSAADRRLTNRTAAELSGRPAICAS